MAATEGRIEVTVINIGDCIKVKKIDSNEDGSTDVEFEYTKQFITLYKAATGDKRARKRDLKKYLYKILDKAGNKWRGGGGGIPCIIPLKREGQTES